MNAKSLSARRVRPMLAALALAAGSMMVAAAAPATAAEELCDGTTTSASGYVVQNNTWNTEETQCLNVDGDGFEVTQADGSVPTDGGPKSYPSIYDGCHYGNCSDGTSLPVEVGSISSAPSSVSYSYTDSGTYNAAYDIWLDPEPNTESVNQTEIMIWLNKVGDIAPIGSETGTAEIAGQTWTVWEGSNGENDVISFIAPSAIDSLDFDIKDFVDETVAHGLADDSWYVTSVQAGFEPWEGGEGLAVTDFSTEINAG